MKGIILAGGAGTRLYPATHCVSKQLIPIYDKPMIYYPLSILMEAKIRHILLISTPDDIGRYQQLFENGSKWGLQIEYAVQQHPNGLAEAFLLGEQFINKEPCAMILGDNLFFGNELAAILQKASQKTEGATIFAYKVNDPARYGVVEFDKNGRALSIVEKPKEPKSRYAITGLYFYDRHVADYARSLKPSQRGELEITDLNHLYLKAGSLEVIKLNRGIAWLDTGTFDSLMDASLFIQTIQRRQGVKIACLEEIAYKQGFINQREFRELASRLQSSSYGHYLNDLLEEMDDENGH